LAFALDSFGEDTAQIKAATHPMNVHPRKKFNVVIPFLCTLSCPTIAGIKYSIIKAMKHKKETIGLD